MATRTISATKTQLEALRELLVNQKLANQLAGDARIRFRGGEFTRTQFQVYALAILNEPNSIAQEIFLGKKFAPQQLVEPSFIDGLILSLESAIPAAREEADNKPYLETEMPAADAVTKSLDDIKQPESSARAKTQEFNAKANEIAKQVMEQNRLKALEDQYKALEEELVKVTKEVVKNHGLDTQQTSRENILTPNSRQEEEIHTLVRRVIENPEIHKNDAGKDIPLHLAQELKKSPLNPLLKKIDDAALITELKFQETDAVKANIDYVYSDGETPSKYQQEIKAVYTQEAPAIRAKIINQLRQSGVDDQKAETLINTLEKEVFAHRITNRHDQKTPIKIIDKIININQLEISDPLKVQFLGYSHLLQSYYAAEPRLQTVSRSLESHYNSYSIQDRFERPDSAISFRQFQDILLNRDPQMETVLHWLEYSHASSFDINPSREEFDSPSGRDIQSFFPRPSIRNINQVYQWFTGKPLPGPLGNFATNGIRGLFGGGGGVAGTGAVAGEAVGAGSGMLFAPAELAGVGAATTGTAAAGGLFSSWLWIPIVAIVLIFVVAVVYFQAAPSAPKVALTQTDAISGTGSGPDDGYVAMLCTPDDPLCPKSLCPDCQAPVVCGSVTQCPFDAEWSHEKVNAVDYGMNGCSAENMGIYARTGGVVSSVVMNYTDNTGYIKSPEGYGNYIDIEYADSETGRTFILRYAHLSNQNYNGFEPKTTSGQTISANQIIGYGDHTGNSSNPHLHFEIRATDGGTTPSMHTLISGLSCP